MATEHGLPTSPCLNFATLFEKIATIVANDEHMQKVITFTTSTGPGSGRGRPPKLQPQPATNKLLLQLESLRRRYSLTWDTVEDTFNRITEGDPLQGVSLKSEIQGAIKDALKAQDLDYFFSLNVESIISFRNIGPHLLKLGIQRKHLMDPSLMKQLKLPTGSLVSNGVVVDLMTFSKITMHVNTRAVLENLGANISTISDQTLSRKLNDVMTKYKGLSKSLHHKNGSANMNVFLDQEFNSLHPQGPPQRTLTQQTSTEQSLSASQCTNARLRRQLEDTELQLKAVQNANNILQESTKEKNQQLLALEEEIKTLKKRLQDMKMLVENKEEALRTARATVTHIKRTNFYKRNKRKEMEIKRQEAVITQHMNMGCNRIIRKLRKDKKLLQTRASNARKDKERLRASSDKKINQLKQDIVDLLTQERNENAAEQERVVRLKDEKGNFLHEAKVCVMALVGECEVPATRCGEVIRTVVWHILNARVPETDLPSQRSALRFSDQAHVITKAHVMDVLMEQDNYDLHIDGTSRSGNKYISQSVNTPEGTLSLGYTPLAREDTSSLLEVTIQMLEEVSDLSASGEEAQEKFLQLLSGLSTVMSDRAAVMKSYGRALEEERRLLLDTEDGMNFLHCNAHFLLGLASEIKKTLAEEDKTRPEIPPGFRRAGECLVYRFIRLACDCLGPRGDDKNGCRDTWLAYCATIAQRPSTISSFRENRFNNTFQGAASLHYHRQEVQDCLEIYLPHRNQKVQTVVTDSKDETTDVHLVALGLIYFRITGPYWQLLGTKVHYLDFYQFVGDLVDTLRAWQDDPSSALSPDCPPVFRGIHFQEQPNVLQSLLAISEEKAELVKVVLKKLAKAMMTATERQLADFLPGGKYHSCEDEELRQKLAHSLVTNLVAEESFADLDFSLFKRRNGSLHHHSTIAMLKKNKSISNWFLHQSHEDQQNMMSMSAKKAQSLRKQHQQLQANTLTKRRELMEAEKRKRDTKEQKRTQKQTEILDTLKLHNGPCTSADDLDRMLQVCTTSASLKTGLRAEVLFQKLVLGKKSPLLQVTGKPLEVLTLSALRP
ncbi:hypothetical protein V1264_006907 [Littorina saxatilis]|uniref:Uncharacterized protein n=1 Tax=Littorina saxatilis TaxID=31220 RepID=A0AAN9AYW4_9CAEN